MTAQQISGTFYGWRVVAAVFVSAVFGLGMGFHGPPIYLLAVREARGWSLALVADQVFSRSPEQIVPFSATI